jgi:hypothetical protein
MERRQADVHLPQDCEPYSPDEGKPRAVLNGPCPLALTEAPGAGKAVPDPPKTTDAGRCT